MPNFQTRPDPTHTEARARRLAGSAIALTAMGFLTVAFSFDASAARRAPATSDVASMAAFTRADASPAKTVTRKSASAATPDVVPVPVPVVLATKAAPASATKAGPAARGPSKKGPRVADKPRPPVKKTREAKLRPASKEDAQLVSDAISTRMTALGRCYERALLRDPGLAGKMSVRVEVAPDGRVTSAKVRRSTIRNPWLKGCVEQRIAGWRLPHLNDGSPVRVTIPVNFVR